MTNQEKMNPVAKRIQAILDDRDIKLKTLCDDHEIEYYSIRPWWDRPNSKAPVEKITPIARALNVPVTHLSVGAPICADPRQRLISLVHDLDDALLGEVERYLQFLDGRKP
jgi:hypothetical protein